MNFLPKSPEEIESHIQKIINVQEIHIHISLLTNSQQRLNPCPKPQLNPKSTKIPCVTQKIWGYDAKPSYFMIKSSYKSVALQ